MDNRKEIEVNIGLCSSVPPYGTTDSAPTNHEHHSTFLDIILTHLIILIILQQQKNSAKCNTRPQSTFGNGLLLLNVVITIFKVKALVTSVEEHMTPHARRAM